MTTARERVEDLRRSARKLALALASGKSDDWDVLRTLGTGAPRKGFINTITWLWFLGGAAVAGRAEMVTWLLEAGVDPNYYANCSEPSQWCDFPLTS